MQYNKYKPCENWKFRACIESLDVSQKLRISGWKIKFFEMYIHKAPFTHNVDCACLIYKI